MSTRRAIGTALLAVLLVVAGGCGREVREFISAVPTGIEAAPRTGSRDENNTEGKTSSAEAAKEACIYVYVCGEVVSPGVYPLPEGSRAYEAVDAAGGLTEEADREAVNLARILKDGEQVTVPAVREASEGAAPPGKVNINTADAEALTTLSGVGPSRAEDIIAYRQKHGPFAAVEDVMNVTGIGNALYEKIKDDITVG